MQLDRVIDDRMLSFHSQVLGIMAELRSKDKLWLVDGLATDSFSDNKLPTREDVLKVLEWHSRRDPRDLQGVVRKTSLMLQVVWGRANIPMIDPTHLLKKVRQLREDYSSLKKSRSRESAKELEKRESFKAGLKQLFDVAHRDAMSLMTIQEDKDFLECQRKPGRQGKMAGVDEKWCEKEGRRAKRKLEEEKRAEREKESRDKRTTSAVLEDSTSSSSADPSPSASPAKRTPHRKMKVITPDVAAALDRSQISVRGAMQALVPFATQLGANVEQLSISPSTIHRNRRQHREGRAVEIRRSFSPTVPLTLHWDGKLMPSLTDGNLVDRLPILVSGEGVSKLLAVPATSGKAEPTTTTILNTLGDWNLADRVAALCFDTTATNTGAKGGVCVRLQQILGRGLLHLACRHHILELLLEAVFSALVPEVSQSPDIAIFQHFKDFWPFAETSDYQTADENVKSQAWVADTVAFCQEQLQHKHPREDYRELLELVVIYLGGLPHGRKEVTFKKPGALHRARWMARAIYGLKMWLFLTQFATHRQQRPSSSRAASKPFLQHLGDFCVFVAKHYVRSWYTASSAASAAREDLSLLQRLEDEPDKRVKEAGIRTLSRHLWYFSEITIGLTIFDEKVSADEKREFVLKMRTVEGAKNPPPRIQPPGQFKERKLADFATKNTVICLQLLKIDQTFLEKDPKDWGEEKSFKEGLERVKGIQVTNDMAERGVALVQEFTDTGRTKSEDQLQFLLQVVSQHRQEYPKATKKCLMKK